MGKRREASGYSLVIGVDKPAGMTSHDVVDRIRRIYGERRVGHTGTLDPAATGALAVCVGPATRLDRFLVGHRKEYEFTVVFGAATDTDDAQGRVFRCLSETKRQFVLILIASWELNISGHQPIQLLRLMARSRMLKRVGATLSN